VNLRERLFNISDLNLSQRLPHMTDLQVEDFIQLLGEFVDGFPSMETGLRAAVEENDGISVSKRLSEIRELLVRMHADDLADECWKKINNLKISTPNKIAAYVNYILSMLATLSIDIQVRLNNDNIGNQPEVSQGDQGRQNGVKVILAVDDETFSLDVLKAALKGVSCRVIGVTSGADALNVLKAQKPDLFVLDIDMPEMNGIELAKRIKESGQASPIIFITGNAAKDYVMAAIDAGASDFILKPINPQSATKRIGKFLH